MALFPLQPVLHGQQVLPDFQTEWKWADFGRESGFLGSRVYAMLEVGDTLWARSDQGVFWFDQYSWHRVGPGEGIPDGPASSLSLDDDGEIFLVVGGSAFKGSAKGFRPFEVPGLGREDFDLHKLVASPWGLVITAARVSDREMTVFIWQGDRVREVLPHGGVSVSWTIWKTQSGTVWLGADFGLFFLEDGEWQPHVGPTSEYHRFSALWETPDGIGFASQITPLSTRGLRSWNAQRRITHLPSEGQYSVLSGTTLPDGITYAVYDSGDLRAFLNGRWVTPALPPLRAQGLHFVFSDARGDLWFGTRLGLHLFRRSLDRWSGLSFPFPDSRNRVNDLLITKGGTLWMATHGGLARTADDGSWEWIHEILGREIDAVTGVAEDEEGGVWVTSGASFEGALRYFQGEWKAYGASEGLDAGLIHRVYPLEDGSVWFAALGSGVDNTGAGAYRWMDGRFERWTDERNWLESRTYAVAEGEDGSFWFGLGRGVARFRDGEWSYWGADEGLGTGQSRRVFTILPTDGGGALAGFGPMAGDGLAEIRPDGSVRDLSPEADLLAVGVSELARDPEGVIWATTDRGVLRHSDGIWSLFDATSGMAPEASWPLEFRDGQVLIGTTGGGLRILNLAEASGPPPRVELFGPVLVEGRSFRVRWRVFGWRGQMDPELILIRDRLPGGEWSDWGTHREMWTSAQDDFGWGEKTVQLQAKGLFGRLSEPVTVKFVIPSPILLRPVFYLPLSTLGTTILVLLLIGVSRRRKNAEAIRERESTLRTLVDTAPDGIAIYDADADRFLDVNANVLRITQLTREEFLRTRLGGTSPEIGPDGRSSRDYLLEKVEEALAGKTVVFEWTSRSLDGSRIPTQMHLTRFPSREGRLVRFSVLDITDRKESERKQKELEGQLRQSQKLEAVGQLTGGVAHDFNNLLTVIMGNLELLKESQDAPEVQELLEGALGAAARSALLTQRLLAFSRRQALDNKPLELGALVGELLGLLERSLGETITIHTDFPENLWIIHADPGQLEHAIINLSVNARDAMPRGGDLYLEGSNRWVEEDVAKKWGGKAGPYVCLSVTDTGIGMEPNVRDRAIDPFFTTKAVGAGSGLGLSMVYGFVKQSGGFVKIYSELGSGTAVQLFLPMAEAESADEGYTALEHDRAPEGRGEVILVVEDEPLLLDLTQRVCEGLGYRAIPAENGDTALAVLLENPEVQLLFSDVVLPGGMDGVQLAMKARELRPDLPVLFTSGYAEQSVFNMARDLSDFLLVPKPFDSATLARKIRVALDTRGDSA